MIEYEKIQFRKFPKRYVSVDQVQEYAEKILQLQHSKTIEDVLSIVSKCLTDQIADIVTSDIVGAIRSTPSEVGLEIIEKDPDRGLPFYRINKDHKNIKDLYNKYIDSDNNNNRYEVRKEGNSEMVNHNAYGSFMKNDDTYEEDNFGFDIMEGDKEQPKHYTGSQDSEYDVVKKPEHYNYSKIQPKDVIRAWGLNFNLGSAVKYIARAGHKDDIIQDLSKAIQFIQFELEYYNDHVLNGQCESTVMDYVADKILEYYEYANDEDNEYNMTLVRKEWDLASEKQSLGFAIDYIHMFHYIGGCSTLLNKAIKNIQDYIDIIEKERNESNE